MPELSVIDAGTIAEGAHLAGLLPYLKEYIGKLERALDKRTIQRLSKAELTPELALIAWQEKNALRSVLTHFTQAVRIGVSVAEENIEEL